MQKILIPIVFAAIALPSLASAHASPVSYEPGAQAVLKTAPEEVAIRFSERLEEGASRVVVVDEKGATVSSGAASVASGDPYTLSVPVAVAEAGTYFVTWSVVSRDDGHFTRGQYAYFVGKAAAASVPQTEVIQSSAGREAAAIGVELVGNSILWGVIVLFAVALRTRVRDDAAAKRPLVMRFYRLGLAFGGFLALIGAGVGICLKSAELASLSSLRFLEAIPVYLSTAAGEATLVRAGIVVALLAFAFLRSRAIVASARLTLSEGMLFALLIGFAYFRAKISHATANPFFPEASILINLVHLVGKDAWAGLVLALSGLYLWQPLRALAAAAFPRAAQAVSYCFAAASVTACYIVWLHLKDYGNLTTTLWGERFILLSVCGALAALALAVHLVGYRYRPDAARRAFPYLLGAESALGIGIIFFSSLMIITSPPLERPYAPAHRASSHGLTMELSRAPYEDSMALVTVEGEGAKRPTVLVGEGEGGLLVDLTERFFGGYMFPLSVLGAGEARVSIQVPQEGGYDGQAFFKVSREDLEGAESSGRRFDGFTAGMIGLSIFALLMSLGLMRLAREVPAAPSPARSAVPLVALFVATGIALSQALEFSAWAFGNQYKKECLRDGGAWHLMLPMRDGATLSTESAEGCMPAYGMLHMPDAREYRFLKSSGPSEVTFLTDLSALAAGVPQKLSFFVENVNGTPARLMLSHERLVHVMVVSRDMRDFYHVHPPGAEDPMRSTASSSPFELPFTFPREGEYLVAVSYANGLADELQTQMVQVGDRGHSGMPERSPHEATFDGYDVSFDQGLLLAGQPGVLTYRIKKDGKDVTDLEPYLSAAMHVAIVRNDLAEFIHAHGEVHPYGAPLTHAAAHQHAPPPARFGPVIETHLTGLSSGRYTVFGEFKHEGRVVLTRFTIDVR